MRERLQALWEQKRDTPLAQICVLIIAVVLAWQLGRLLWLLWSGPGERLPVTAGASSGPVVVRVEPVRIAALFGESPAAAEGAVVDTTLQLRLDGVLENPDSTRSRAFIAERSNGKVLIYRPGESVPGGAKLDSVESDHVVLTRAGREEILRFDKPGTPQPAAAAAGGPQPGNNASQVRSALSSIAQNMASSPMAMLRQVGLRRTSQGYIVSIAAPKDILNRYGLRPGDRIVSINGQQVGKDLDADQQVLGQLQQTGSARVEVQRGAQTITLEQRL